MPIPRTVVFMLILLTSFLTFLSMHKYSLVMSRGRRVTPHPSHLLPIPDRNIQPQGKNVHLKNTEIRNTDSMTILQFLSCW